MGLSGWYHVQHLWLWKGQDGQAKLVPPGRGKRWLHWVLCRHVPQCWGEGSQSPPHQPYRGAALAAGTYGDRGCW